MKKLVFLVLVAFVALVGHAKVVYVKPNGTGTTGTSWAEAVGTIADAMKNVQSGDAIYVATGTYTEPWGTLKAGVSIFGGFAGTETSESERERGSDTPYDFSYETVITVVDARVVNAAVSFSNESSMWIDGFTFKDCSNDATVLTLRGGMNLRNCRFISNNTVPPASGVGTNNIVFFNVSAVNATTETSSTVVDCLFDGNRNQQNQNILGVTPGADNCNVVIERVVFRNNVTDLPSGSTNANILLCGGSMGQTSVRNCLFYNNSSKQAVINSSANSEIVNCLIYNNNCGTNNVLLAGRMYNSLVVNNTSRFCFNNNNAKLYNTVVVGNKTTGLALNGDAITTPEAKNCAVEKNLPARGIYDAIVVLPVATDAKFVRATSFQGMATSAAQEAELVDCDWRLQITSPLVNGGLSSWFKESEYGKTANKDYTNNHVRYYGTLTDINAYEADKRQLTIIVDEGGETITNQSGYYMAAQSLELSVAPQAGYRIKEWKDESGTVVSTQATFTYVMPNADKTLTVSFEPTDTKFQFTVVAGTGGTVTDVSGMYFPDQPIALTATPAIGYQFENWTDATGEVLSTEANFSYTMPSEASTVTANFRLKADDAVGTHQFDFEGLSVNEQWKAVDGTLSISDERSQSGTQSLHWKTASKQSNKLRIELVNDYLTATLVTCYFNLYNKTALNGGTLEINFFNASGTIIRTATQSMNFIGWREFERRYGVDFTRKTSTDRVVAIEFTLNNPEGEATDLYFDQVNLAGSVSSVRFVSDWCAPDSKIFGTAGLFGDYAPILDATLPVTTPSEEELSGLAVVRSRYPVEPRAGDIVSARKFVQELKLTRNSDGTIKGAPVALRNFSLLTTDQILAIATRIETLGYAAKTSEDDKQLLNDYLDYLLDQGTLYRTTAIASNDYTTVRNMGQALTKVLGACQTERQSLEWANIVFWMMSYGQIYQSDYSIKMNSDIMYNYIEFYMAAAANIMNPAVAVREVKGMMRYMNRASEITPGGYDILKPDGTGFHHGTHYPNYMYAYRGWVDVLYNVRGTVFRVSPEAYEGFKKAAISMCLLATRGANNYIANSMGGRNPFSGNKLMFYKQNMENLSVVGGDVYGKAKDAEVDEFIAYLFDGASTSTKYDGYYAFNWSPAGVYRHDNWVATMRSATTKFWGSEIYSSRNRFGRYQSHGTLEVLYNNQSTPTGYPAGRDESGWDWNVVPGGTTVHYTNWSEMMPNKNLTQRFDQYTKTKDFCGALPFEGSGVFAADFDQGETWSVQCFQPTNLSFKKSVFAFDGMLISLGSNITSTVAAANTGVTATNLFQSFKPVAGPNVKGTVITPTETITDYTGATWMITPEGTGYYIPNGNDKVSLFYGTQSSPKDDATNLNSPGSAVAAKAYINHGITPSEANYHFVVIPGADAASMQAAVNRIGEDGGDLYTINSQDATLHSLTYKPLATTAYAFFEAKSGLTFGNVLSAASEMLLMEKAVSQTRLAYGVCNPNLRPEAASSGWTATPTHTSITVKGLWGLASPVDGNVIVSNDGVNTTVTLTLKDGLPVYFELDSQSVGLTSELAASYQVWTEDSRLHIVSDRDMEVSVFNTTGVQVAFSEKAVNHTLSLSGGVYVIRLQSGDSMVTVKTVIP
ncbi:InlB B-repeat-containing protein [Bacteroides sp.]